MKLKDIMSNPVEIVSPDTTLVDVARKMKDSGTGFIPVCDGERVHGVVTDRDLVVRGIAGGKPAATTKAREVMTNGVCYCFEDQDLKDASRTMRENGVRRLIVVDKEKRLVGMVSLGDLARKGDDLESAVGVIRNPEGPVATI